MQHIPLNKRLVIVAIVVILLAATLPLVVIKVETSPAPIYVPDDYLTIQAAVDAANPGDTIIIRDGIYTENIDIDKSLTIVSENGVELTSIQAARADDHIFHLTAGNVTVSGLSIYGANDWGYAGIYLDSVSGCTIANNRCGWDFNHKNRRGISLSYSHGNMISQNTCNQNNDHGVMLEYSNDNTVVGNTCNQGLYGIGLYHASDNTISQNTCNQNISGCYLDQSDNNTLTGNTCNQNMCGIGLPYSSYNIISENTCEQNSESGIYLDYSVSNALAANTMVDNGIIIWGYSVENWNTHTIDTSNTVNGAPVYYWSDVDGGTLPQGAGGIILANCRNVVVENQNVSHGTAGIQLGFSTNNILRNNISSENTRDGILMVSSSGNMAYLNSFNDNGRNIRSYESVNVWNSPGEMTYTYDGSDYTSYVGNYWSDYAGMDVDPEDGIGDTGYSIDIDQDSYPLVEPLGNVTLGDPDISLDTVHLDFECGLVSGVESGSSGESNDFEIHAAPPPIPGITVNPLIALHNADSGQGIPYGCGESEGIGVRNPAALYCMEMGYEYKVVETGDGEKGVCVLPDGEECDAWAFYKGECGSDFSYCAQNGWQVASQAERDSFSTECITCVMPDESVRTVSSLLDLEKKSTVGISELNVAEELVATIHDRYSTSENGVGVPSYFDWRDSGGDWMTPVKDQGGCGSCWSFSVLGIVEPKYNIVYGSSDLDLDLSEQFMVSDCSSAGSCCGGWMYSALDYVRTNGVPDEECFPYVDAWGCTCGGGTCDSNCDYRYGGECSDSTCSDRCPDWGTRLRTIDSPGYVSSNVETIKQCLINEGPLSVAMGIGSSFGGYWDNGIYRCSDDSGVNHGVVIAGYDESDNSWIVKNSWGSDWNGDGYFKVGCGECAIENYVYSVNLAAEENCDSVTITNDGLSDLVVDDIEIGYQFGEPTGWLDVFPRSFTIAPGESQPVVVCVDCSQLSPNTYHGWLDIRSNDLDEDPFRVTVRTNFADYSYDLTVASDGCCPVAVSTGSGSLGTIDPGSSGTFYNIMAGTVVYVDADDSGVCCEFQEWTGDAGGNSSSATVTMDAHKSLTAHCGIPGPYALTTNTSPPEGGSVSGNGTYDCGTFAEVQAIPADDSWYFTGWSGNLTGSDNPATVLMDSSKTVIAEFVPATTVEGAVDLQGRPYAPDDSWITPLTVALFEQGSDTLIGDTQSIDTDGEGAFDITAPESSTCDIGLKCPRSLSRLASGVLLSSPGLSLDFGTLLEGDSNNDDYIGPLDYSILRMYYGSTTPEALGACDFNLDDYVDGFDYSLLRANYGEEGEIPLWPLP
ncbi:MAG: NosD domain-containing protein [Chloroflexota bacterium]|nr:NosD domain-containing protein [Chloroflexota bacterium]